MQKKVWIGLEGMEFYAHHGVYEEEQLVGGTYIVDILVYTNALKAEQNDDLSGTVNYELIYETAKKNMEVPVKLIEHLARKIINDLRRLVAEDDTIRIKIRKMHPPLGAYVEASVVEITD